MMEIALKIPRVVFANLLEIVATFLSIGYLAISWIKPHEARIDKSQIPILLLHGSSSNEGAWTFGRPFLKGYGSVFSLNYDGLLKHDFSKGIEDHALGKVREKVREIKRLTAQDRLIVIGQSMGGLVGGYYAENVAHLDGVRVEHLISISSPWQGTSLLNYYPNKWKPKRYQQMSIQSAFRAALAQKAVSSDRSGVRKYYSVGSTADWKVPDRFSHVTDAEERKRTFSYLGHDGLMLSIRVWLQIRSWLNAIYWLR